MSRSAYNYRRNRRTHIFPGVLLMLKFLTVLRIVLTHLYVWIALYLGAVFVKNTVDFHGFVFQATKAFYALVVKT